MKIKQKVPLPCSRDCLMKRMDFSPEHGEMKKYLKVDNNGTSETQTF